MAKITDALVEKLQNAPNTGAVFNPWFDVDPVNDIGSRAPQIRRNHLRHFLEQRLSSARYLLIAEAVGYQGGHFSGIAMTSERILLGYLTAKGVQPEYVVSDITLQRTSKQEIIANGFSEPTATIVWQAIVSSDKDPYEFILWNIFPWHPFQPEKGLLSNRTPTKKELLFGVPVVEEMLTLWSNARIAAVGRKSAQILGELGIAASPMRHPAQGGATQFRKQFSAWIK
ncbi:MAG: uracil-DNA glycosylase [bacterium]